LYVDIVSLPPAKELRQFADRVAGQAQAPVNRGCADLRRWNHPELRVIQVVKSQNKDPTSQSVVILGPIYLFGAHPDLRLGALGDFELQPYV
jgi:hypothetical protein